MTHPDEGVVMASFVCLKRSIGYARLFSTVISTKGGLCNGKEDRSVEGIWKTAWSLRDPTARISDWLAKKDGSIEIGVRVNSDLVKNVNTDFLGKWQNAENIGKTEEEIIALWNVVRPDDPIVVD